MLYPRDFAPVIGLAREISISGMFVEVPQQKLTMNSLIEVGISIPGGEEIRTFRWHAMVIRQTHAGAGLMFDRLRPPAVMRLLAEITNVTLPRITSTTRGVLAPVHGGSRRRSPA